MPSYTKRDQNHGERRGVSRQADQRIPKDTARVHSSQKQLSATRRSQRPYRSNRNYRTISGHDTGYTLHQRSINFNGRRDGVYGNDRRRLIFIIIAIAALILVVLVISSCTKGCSSDTDNQTNEVNSQDSRVASGTSSDVTELLTPALDVADDLNTIAQNADKYSDSRMIELAVSEPEAAHFVASYLDADKSAQSFDDSVTKGSYPELFEWDSRWGNIDYADSAFGVTGSGPTVISMAYMGLTGSSDKTPDIIAELATSAGYASGDAGLTTDFFTNTLSEIGLSGRQYTSSADNIIAALEEGKVVAVLLKADTLSTYAHWVLITSEASDGSIQVNDPTSASITSHTWAASTIAADADTIYVLSASQD